MPEDQHKQNGNGDMTFPKWFMSISILVYTLALPWAIWVTNTLYHVKYQTESGNHSSAYVTSRLDKLGDNLRDLERRVDRGLIEARDARSKE